MEKGSSIGKRRLREPTVLAYYIRAPKRCTYSVAWLSGRASPSHGGGHRFKSCSDHHELIGSQLGPVFVVGRHAGFEPAGQLDGPVGRPGPSTAKRGAGRRVREADALNPVATTIIPNAVLPNGVFLAAARPPCGPPWRLRACPHGPKSARPPAAPIRPAWRPLADIADSRRPLTRFRCWKTCGI